LKPAWLPAIRWVGAGLDGQAVDGMLVPCRVLVEMGRLFCGRRFCKGQIPAHDRNSQKSKKITKFVDALLIINKYELSHYFNKCSGRHFFFSAC
jgi:hypothetical protein